MLRSSGEARSSNSMRLYATWFVGGALHFAGCAQLAPDAEDVLTNPHGAWRALWLVSQGLIWIVVCPQIFWLVMLEPAVQFLGGIDLARSKQLSRYARTAIAVPIMLLVACVAGEGLALFGTTAGAQSTGVVLFLVSCGTAVVAVGAMLLRMAHMLKAVHDDQTESKVTYVIIRNKGAETVSL